MTRNHDKEGEIDEIPLGNNGGRRRYLEKLVGQLNNELIDPALTPADRSRFYNSLLAAIKLIHDIDCKNVLLNNVKELELEVLNKKPDISKIKSLLDKVKQIALYIFEILKLVITEYIKKKLGV